MPYKHIASQLKKTELACRLHYHQLSFGSKARRASGVRTFERSSAPPSEKRRKSDTPIPQRQLPAYSPPESPPQLEEESLNDASRVPQCQNKPLLPRPIPSIQQRTPSASQPLRLITKDMDSFHERHCVDVTRLDRLYESHRLHFWSTVARSYGCNLSPAVLEEAWCRAHGMNGSKFPPTPRGSPKASPSSCQVPFSSLSKMAPYTAAPSSAITDSPGKGFTPINYCPEDSHKPVSTRTSSFSVSSLLTEDKDVRSPSRERKADIEMTFS